MRYRVYAITFAFCVWVSVTGYAQRYTPGFSQDAATPARRRPMADKPPPADLPPTTSTVHADQLHGGAGRQEEARA